MKIILAAVLAACFALFYPHDGHSLEPMVDLSGEWSGSVHLQDISGYCAYEGSVTASIRQDGSVLNGQYQFVMTSAKPTGKLEGLESCYLEPIGGKVTGRVDGTLVTLVDSSGLQFSGSATNDLLTLNFGDEYVIGTAKLQQAAKFSKPTPQKPAEPKKDDTKQMVERGISYLQEKRYDKAIEYFNKVIGMEPKNIMGWMGKGVALAGMKNYDTAITHFKKALEIAPDNKDALQWLARTYYLKNDCKTASDYYSAALKAAPNDSKIAAEKKMADSCITKQADAKKSQSAARPAEPPDKTDEGQKIKSPETQKPSKGQEKKKPAQTDTARWDKTLNELAKQKIPIKAKLAGKILQSETIQNILLPMLSKEEGAMAVTLFKYYTNGPDKAGPARPDYTLASIPPKWQDWIAKETKGLRDGTYNLSPYYDKTKRSGGPDDLVHALGHFDVTVMTNADGTRTYLIEDLYHFGFDPTKKLEQQRHGFTFTAQSSTKIKALESFCSLVPAVEHPVGGTEGCIITKSKNTYQILIPQPILSAAGKPFVIKGEFTK